MGILALEISDDGSRGGGRGGFRFLSFFVAWA